MNKQVIEETKSGYWWSISISTEMRTESGFNKKPNKTVMEGKLGGNEKNYRTAAQTLMDAKAWILSLLKKKQSKEEA